MDENEFRSNGIQGQLVVTAECPSGMGEIDIYATFFTMDTQGYSHAQRNEQGQTDEVQY